MLCYVDRSGVRWLRRWRRGSQRQRAAAAAVRAGDRRAGQGPSPSHHLPRQQQLPHHHTLRVSSAAALPHLCALVSIISICFTWYHL